MRTLVLSDIHLGNGAGYDIFAGGEALPRFLDTFTRSPTRVILNGDSADFLMNEDELTLDPTVAERQARAIVESLDGRRVMEAFGRILASGGEVNVRLGNHDIELALPGVQAVFRAGLGQPADVAERLLFQNGDQPAVLEIGGARILVTHGEQNDPWNRIDYPVLLGATPQRFAYPPGSRLVRTLLNPLKRQFGMRFADLLKPDFQGGALTALAVDPSSVKTLFAGSTAVLLWQLLRRHNGPATFGELDEDLGLADRVDEAGLDEAERDALEALLDDGPLSFADDPAVTDSALIKLGIAGLKCYAKLQKRSVGDATERFFSLEPEPEEWTEARRLATKYRTSAVLFGHSHAARWRQDEGVLLLNTGTWIWLMRLPPADADVATWTAYLERLRRDPGLERGEDLLTTAFTAALLEDDGAGAAVSLLEWKDGDVVTWRRGRVAAG